MDYENSLSLFAGPTVLLALLPLIWFILCIILFFKVWFACNDIADLQKANSKIYDLEQDLQFWTRAKYESDKRLSVITEADIVKAEAYLSSNAEK